MLKEKLVKALAKSMDAIRHESDNLPIGMRGELEIIVKDRDGNVVSYERGHNQVTNFAKMQIIHLLAGEYGVEDRPIYSVADGDTLKKRFAFTQPSGGLSAPVKQGFKNTDHSSTINNDGCILSGKNFFDTISDGDIKELSQVSMTSLTPEGKTLQPNQPVKMLFGTGIEATTTDEITKAYSGEGVTNEFINKINGFEAKPELNSKFLEALEEDPKRFTNYYSGTKIYVSGDQGLFRARTLQPASTSALNNVSVAKTDNSITGAIKNCYIEQATGTDSDAAKYDSTTKMAFGKFRGVGYPSYIYARKKTGVIGEDGFYNSSSKTYINYGINTQSSSDYETEVTYVVDMPAQPANVDDVLSFYPYNGWILRQAGLFSDARFFLRSIGNEETAMTQGYPDYVNSASGMLLFKRNLSSPILKTPDLQVTFAWHVYITV